MDNHSPAWSLPTDALLNGLSATPAGLTGADAAERLRRDGPNQVADQAHGSALSLLVRQFQSPLVLILVFAAGVAGVLSEWLEASIILAIVLGSTLLGFLQEFRASAAVAELRRRLALKARVRRDGEVNSLPFEAIVAGDIVQLSAGAVAPADAVLLSAQDLMVTEAALTGESFPVEKRPGEVAADSPAGKRSNMVFLGTSVRSGSGEAVVVATGRRTEFGLVAERLKAKPAESDFARSLRRFGGMLIRVMILVVLFVLIMNQLLGRPFIDSLLFAVALGVGLSPELLPAIISVTLSAGARRLAREGVVVRQLEAIENLGGMTVFCTDKTGTLTEGDIRLEAATGPDGAASPAVGRLAFLNAALESGIENPLDQAIVAWGKAAGMTAGGVEKLGEIPYDFMRKRLSIIVRDGAAAPRLICKGAFDNVLAICDRLAGPDGAPVPLDDQSRAAVLDLYRQRGEAGFRVLALASREVEARAGYSVADEAGLTLEGLLVFMDPPKPEAAGAIRDLAALDVRVKVISGDNRHVVAHVAQTLGLSAARVMTGAEVAAMKDEALWHEAAHCDLFAEIDPQQKERIVRALQRTGESVGYLGDGINDAPALYAADVGVSVDQAVDVARESADVVLLRRDLDVLRLGVEGGRRTFANTLKYVCITISANFGNMISMAIATPLLPFLPMTAAQILLNNFLSDLPAVALASDRVDASQLARPQHMGVRQIQRFMIVFGLVSSAFDLMTFAVLLWLFRAGVERFQTAWFVLSLLTELAVVLVLRTRGPAWASRPGGLLLGVTAAVAALALASPYLGPVSAVFGLTALPAGLLAALVALAAGYVLATEAVKRWFFRPGRPRAGRRGHSRRTIASGRGRRSG